eukprot:5012454-Prymnesium_polylepis.2
MGVAVRAADHAMGVVEVLAVRLHDGSIPRGEVAWAKLKVPRWLAKHHVARVARVDWPAAPVVKLA